MIKNNDQKIRSLQIARDKEDEDQWSKAWWGAPAIALKRRAQSLDECVINIAHGAGNYAVLQFVVGDGGRDTVYGLQNFYLRNQWDGEAENGDAQRSYWYEDAGSSWMQGTFDSKIFQDQLHVNGELYKNATQEQKDYTSDLGSIRKFSKEEKDIVAECVLPTVRRVDEIISKAGKSAQDYGYKMGKAKDTTQGEARTWDTELLGVDRTLKLRMFKALHLLSIHAF